MNILKEKGEMLESGEGNKIGELKKRETDAKTLPKNLKEKLYWKKDPDWLGEKTEKTEKTKNK